jgi:hypothetical protein
METTKQNSPENDIDSLLAGYTQKVTVDEEPEQKEPKKKRGRPKKQAEPEIQDSSLISGALFLLLIDLAIPTLLSFVNNKAGGKPVKSKQLKLTKEQREELSPIADEAIKELMIKASPITVFFVSLIGIYGLNFLMLKTDN